MSKKIKVGDNQSCPCGSGKKYKRCCRGQTPWEYILGQGEAASIPYLSIRGKNILFISKVAAALQIDKLPTDPTWNDIKKALTPNSVKKVYESILEVWPPDTDIRKVLSRNRTSNEISGLYTGNYETPYLYRAITRHCLHSDKIILSDPLIYPLSVRDEYNPISNPNVYMSSTLRYIEFWLKMTPWIDSGLVEIVRTPSDFDRKLNWDNLIAQKEKFDGNDELQQLSEKFVEEKLKSDEMAEQRSYMKLHYPNEHFINMYMKDFPDASEKDIDLIINYLNRMREQHRYYLPPVLDEDGKWEGELQYFSMGSNYPDAKQTAELTNSYLITDMPVRWREIELDRENAGVSEREWSPFAKAFQQVPFKFLENADLNSALLLRKENRLEGMRLFLRKVWKNAVSGKPFDEGNVLNLASELDEKVREAESEWLKIDRDLIKFVGGELALALMGAGPLIASGYGNFVAGATAIAGMANLFIADQQRKQFVKRFPAGFFLKLK